MVAELDEGAVIAGRYIVERVIAEGGMGRVVAARHVELDTPVAIKILKADHRSARDVERFRREARAAGRIRGEHVVRVLDVGVLEGDRPFIVMELVDGIDLGARLDADGPMSAKIAVGYVLQACEGIAEAHKLGMVHRDLKPSNLLLASRPDGSEILKVSDFGIAKSTSGPATTLTATADILGSPKYMSPEQVREAHEVDARSDIWSLGVTLYQLLTARWPFEAYTTAGVLVAISADEPVAPRAHVPEIEPALEAVVLRCLEKDPAARIADTKELATALAPFADESDRAAVTRIANTLANPKLVVEPSPSARRLLVAAPSETVSATTSRAAPEPAIAASTTSPRERPAAGSEQRPWRALGIVVLVAVGAWGGWQGARSTASASSAGDAKLEVAPSVTASQSASAVVFASAAVVPTTSAVTSATSTALAHQGAAPAAPAHSTASTARPRAPATESSTSGAAPSVPAAATSAPPRLDGLDLGPRK